jgi:hypothetical protein
MAAAFGILLEFKLQMLVGNKHAKRLNRPTLV